MKLNDLKEYIDRLDGYDKLCIFSKDKTQLHDTLFINPENRKLYEYHNIFLVNEVADDDNNYIFTDLNKDDVQFEILQCEEWCGLKRKINYDNFMTKLNNESVNNTKIIYEDIKRDQGKYVQFLSPFDGNVNYEGYLLALTATDEDYYYVYLDDYNELRIMTCVGDYKIVDENKAPMFTDKEIAKMLSDRFDIDECLEAVVYKGKYAL